MFDAALLKLQQTLAAEMPICTPMGIRATAWDGRILQMEMPLAPNRNHQYSAFAGSLNALCTVVGWGTVFLMLEGRGLSGNVVIRRGSIRYLRPVHDERIICRGRPVDAEAEAFFFELLTSKGQSKIDLETEIADSAGALVSFHGSYVVQD
jgi:thioesterase domain-containing protein